MSIRELMERFIESFNTQEKCDEYRKTLKNREWEIYWKDTGGSIIRESEFADNIGNKNVFATIQLCDWWGWNDEINIHKYTFAVFLYVNGLEDGFTMHETIEDAVKDYKKTCEKIKDILK